MSGLQLCLARKAELQSSNRDFHGRFEGRLKLIYIDPPFDLGADFSMDIEIGGETFHKEPNLLEQISHRDTWGRGADLILERGSSPTNRLSCANQPAYIRLINGRYAVRSAPHTLHEEMTNDSSET